MRSHSGLKAYKFRSADQLPYSPDIIFNGKLRCSDWNALNDPTEGMFVYSYPVGSELAANGFARELSNQQSRLKVCSLSLTYDSHLLRAHYASGFACMAIEVELPDNDPRIQAVMYEGVFCSVPIRPGMKAIEWANRVLVSKPMDWAYEREVRILQEQEWFTLPAKIERIIVGHRMDAAVFQALRIVCKSKGVEINRIGIGDEGIDADRVPNL
jgi:hypothetical protein